MDPQAHWDDVYRQKDAGEVSWFQPVPTRSLDWIEEAAPDRGTSILDVGAGAARLVDHLLERGYRAVGVLELATSALAQVRQRLAERGEAVEWFAGDLLDFSPPHPFDLWHDRAVLHFLREPEQQQRYVEALRRTLRPGGYALIATFAVGGPSRCSGLDIVQYDRNRLSTLLGPEFTCVREEQESHTTPGGSEQLFQYCLYRRDG